MQGVKLLCKRNLCGLKKNWIQNLSRAKVLKINGNQLQFLKIKRDAVSGPK